MSLATRAFSILESLSMSISQVSLYCVKTRILLSGYSLILMLTSLMRRDILGCSTLLVLTIVDTSLNSSMATISLDDFGPLSRIPSSSILMIYALRALMPCVSASSMACIILMAADWQMRPLNTRADFSPLLSLICRSLPMEIMCLMDTGQLGLIRPRPFNPST